MKLFADHFSGHHSGKTPSGMSLNLRKVIFGQCYSNMNLWFEKYRPRTLDDIVLPDRKKEILIDWFVRFQKGETDECALLFTGPPGLGKTSLAHILLNTFGYKIKEFNASDIRSKALIRENLYGFINISDVTTVTKSVGHKPVGLIMDEVDGMFKGDRGGIDELISYISIPSIRRKKLGNSSNRTVPMICICNVGSVKKETIKNLQKECFEMTFSHPDKKALSVVLERVITGEHMQIEEEAKALIMEYAQYDFRRLVGIIEFLYITCGDSITQSHVEWSYDVLSRKEQDQHITDSVKRLINYRLDGSTVYSIYDADKSKAPMVVHQNYLQAIALQKTQPMIKIDNAISCMDSLIVSDITEKIMYNTQSWHLQPIQGFTSTLIPNYYINMYPKTSQLTAIWASVLSVSSQSQNLRKNMYAEIYNVDGEHSYSIEDVQVIIEIVFQHLIAGQTETAIKILLDYDMTELNELIQPNCRKKALLIIDKVAKYVKISHYYSRWAKFRDANKSNKELEQTIRDCVDRYSQTVRVDRGAVPKLAPEPLQAPATARLTVKLRPVIKSKQEQLELVKGRKTVTIIKR
jgi:DNA polymerase III delta prime subunit